MRRLQLVLLFGGVALFVGVVARVGVGRIAEGLTAIGWAFAIGFALELCLHALHAEGWRFAFGDHKRAIPRRNLFFVRIGGFAVNTLTPTATMGGEVVKGFLARRWVPGPVAFGAVVLDKLTVSVSQAAFLAAGMFSLLGRVPLSDTQRLYAIVAFFLWLAGVTAFLVLLRRGALGRGIQSFRGILGASALAERLEGRGEAINERVMTFLHDHPGDFALSTLFHVLGHLIRIAQIHVFLTALGFSPTIETAFTLASGLVFMEATLFIIPARIGVQEGGHALVFGALGFGSVAGITTSFAMRLCELGVGLIGLAALAHAHFWPSEAAREAEAITRDGRSP